MSGIVWARFTDLDWYGLCGAERFADGSEPFIAVIKVDAREAVAVHDAQGIHIMWGDEETVEVYVDASALDALKPEASITELLALPGFRAVFGFELPEAR